MSKRAYLFAAWCLVVFSGVAIASYYGWAPFSGQEQEQPTGPNGPNHK